MKITDLKTFVYMVQPGRQWFFVEVHTDEGVTGLGACDDPRASPMLATGIETLKPLVLGRDPSHINEIWQLIYRNYSSLSGRGYISHLISAIDIALWDIRGKVLGQPVYQLLGGPVRESVPLYTHIQDQSHPGVTTADAVAMARETKAQGYEAIKTDPFKAQRPMGGRFGGAYLLERLSPGAIAEAVDWVAAVREELGAEYELMVDAHARFDVASAIAAARALEPYNLTWFEEPVPADGYEALKQVRDATSIPICVGERLFTRWDFLTIFEQRLADYVMPDVVWTGGISELSRIGAMAEPYYVRFAPHGPFGPVNIMASAHVAITAPTLYRLECVHTHFPLFEKLITPMIDVRDGVLWLDEGRPGLGIELDHEKAEEYRVDPFALAARTDRWRPEA